MNYKNELPRNISPEVERISRHLDIHPLANKTPYVKKNGQFTPVVDDIAWIAKSYCSFCTNPDEASLVLQVVASDLDKNSEIEKQCVSSYISQNLPYTYFPVPKFLQPYKVYPSPYHRRADEIREMFKKPNKLSEIQEQISTFIQNKTTSLLDTSSTTHAMKKLHAVVLSNRFIAS